MGAPFNPAEFLDSRAKKDKKQEEFDPASFLDSRAAVTTSAQGEDPEPAKGFGHGLKESLKGQMSAILPRNPAETGKEVGAKLVSGDYGGAVAAATRLPESVPGLNMVVGTGKAAIDEAKQAYEYGKRGRVGPAVVHGVAAIIPAVGPYLANKYEQIAGEKAQGDKQVGPAREPDPGQAAGGVTGDVLGGLALGGMEKAPTAARAISNAAKKPGVMDIGMGVGQGAVGTGMIMAHPTGVFNELGGAMMLRGAVSKITRGMRARARAQEDFLKDVKNGVEVNPNNNSSYNPGANPIDIPSNPLPGGPANPESTTNFINFKPIKPKPKLPNTATHVIDPKFAPEPYAPPLKAPIKPDISNSVNLGSLDPKFSPKPEMPAPPPRTATTERIGARKLADEDLQYGPQGTPTKESISSAQAKAARTAWGKSAGSNAVSAGKSLEDIQKMTPAEWDAIADDLGLNPSSPGKIERAIEHATSVWSKRQAKSEGVQ